MEISPTYYSSQCWLRLWWHFAFHVTILKFHAGNEFLPVGASSGQIPSPKKNNEIKTYCWCGVTQFSKDTAAQFVLERRHCDSLLTWSCIQVSFCKHRKLVYMLPDLHEPRHHSWEATVVILAIKKNIKMAVLTQIGLNTESMHTCCVSYMLNVVATIGIQWENFRMVIRIQNCRVDSFEL